MTWLPEYSRFSCILRCSSIPAIKIMKTGVTLMEILVVIAIASLLAAAAVPVYQRARLRALVVRTRATIYSIEAALAMYGTDFGDYPACGGRGSRVIAELLQGPVESRRWRGPYIRFRKEDIDEEDNILDAWKTPIIYEYPQDSRDNVPYTLVSAGPDREHGTTDDIGNW